jgi:hypothetical protein
MKINKKVMKIDEYDFRFIFFILLILASLHVESFNARINA